MTNSTQTKPSTDTHSLILENAVLLFSRTGYSGVSMRDIANAVGISVATLYHHFPDKERLYLDAVQHAFANKESQIRLALETKDSPQVRLEAFVRTLVRIMGEDPDFRRLLQRELLDGDEPRLQRLASDIFEGPFKAIYDLAEEIAPGCDAHMLVLSISGMIIHHFEMGPMRRFLPGSKPEHNDPEYITNHITRLLMHGLKAPKGDLP